MIDYTIGNEHSPSDPFGRIVLHIDLDGSARLEHFSRDGVSAWTGQVADAAIERSLAGLDAAGFPAVPQHTPVPGSAQRRLTVEMEGDVETAVIPEQLGQQAEGYADTFAVLDSIAVQLSGGAYQGAQDTIEPSVTDVREAS